MKDITTYWKANFGHSFRLSRAQKFNGVGFLILHRTVEQLVARCAHNAKVAGSSPACATRLADLSTQPISERMRKLVEGDRRGESRTVYTPFLSSAYLDKRLWVFGRLNFRSNNACQKAIKTPLRNTNKSQMRELPRFFISPLS